jgi:OPT family oligopeptide transporter
MIVIRSIFIADRIFGLGGDCGLFWIYPCFSVLFFYSHRVLTTPRIEFDFDAIDEEDSPYPEVRASVSNIDDPDMPALTIRMWFVGLFLCMTSRFVLFFFFDVLFIYHCSAVNVFFNFRDPAPNVVPLALVLISYPIGKFLAFTLPITTYRIPLPYLPRSIFPLNRPSFPPFRLFVNLLLPLTYPRDIEFSLNPGPWNIKEHVLVYIMANVAVGAPYALNTIVVSEVYYGIEMGYWFSLTLVLATQLTGFGLAGLCRRFLVWPASMIWPQNLVACTLLNTLHAEDEDDGIGMYGGIPGSGTKGMTRLRFFLITMTASFFFFFLPGGFLFGFLVD